MIHPHAIALSTSSFQKLPQALASAGVSPLTVMPFVTSALSAHAPGVNSAAVIQLVNPAIFAAISERKEDLFNEFSPAVQPIIDKQKEILEALIKTIPYYQGLIDREEKRRDFGFYFIIGITIFASLCLASALVLSYLGIGSTSIGITVANAIITLPSSTGLGIFVFSKSKRIESLRKDLISLYSIDKKTKSKNIKSD